MDAGKVFVLLVSVLIIGILTYLELNSRRSRQESEVSETGPDQLPPNNKSRKRRNG
jgi:hypothetical protein